MKSTLQKLSILLILLLVGCGSGDKESDISIQEPIVGIIPQEVQSKFGADPTKEDTDNDGLSDDFEIVELFPIALPDKADTDDNGISDADEDFDNDSLSNVREMEYGTNPLEPDTDGDGIDDATEIQEYKTDPLIEDTDGDGLTDSQEFIFNTVLGEDQISSSFTLKIN